MTIVLHRQHHIQYIGRQHNTHPLTLRGRNAELTLGIDERPASAISDGGGQDAGVEVAIGWLEYL
jgi:hypothetical protein